IFSRFAIMQHIPKYLILLFFAFQSMPCVAQNTEEDLGHLEKAFNSMQQNGEESFLSLLNPVLKNPRNYREKMNALYFLGKYYGYKGVVDSALYCGNKLIDLAGEKKDSISQGMLVRAYQIMGN